MTKHFKKLLSEKPNIVNDKINNFKYNEFINTKFMSGGYNYNDIISINQSENTISLEGACKTIGSEINKYGPFAGVYTPEYNNFDIYSQLFGFNKLDDPNSDVSVYKNSKLVNEDKFGNLPYDANIDQNFISKLAKGNNLILFGYGFSGSGKTYALIEGHELEALQADNDNAIASVTPLRNGVDDYLTDNLDIPKQKPALSLTRIKNGARLTLWYKNNNNQIVSKTIEPYSNVFDKAVYEVISK
jgi:hypothetical protein